MDQVGYILMDVAGTTLTAEDRKLLAHPAVAGVVLFRRNFQDKQQLAALCRDLLAIKPMIISVDQEGGRVQRFRDGFSMHLAMRHFGEVYQDDPETAKQALYRATTDNLKELQAVGINLNLMPVLDIDVGKSWVIGGRSFYHSPEVVTDLGATMIQAMHDCRSAAVGKHFPGHGGVAADSHLEVPVDDRDWQALWASDIQPFQKLSSKLDAIMPAHVVYAKMDEKPAGFSHFWLQEILRDKLQFQGVIMSDDLSMEGANLGNSMTERAKLALDAGCDLLLVCNNRQGLIEILKNLPENNQPESQRRMIQFMQTITG